MGEPRIFKGILVVDELCWLSFNLTSICACLQQCLGVAQISHLAALVGEKDTPEILLQHHWMSILYPIEGNRYKMVINMAIARFIIQS
jgi:hypothetical protein